jgi:hypothetical protein
VVEFAKFMAENSHLLWLKFTASPSRQTCPVLQELENAVVILFRSLA